MRSGAKFLPGRVNCPMWNVPCLCHYFRYPQTSTRSPEASICLLSIRRRASIFYRWHRSCTYISRVCSNSLTCSIHTIACWPDPPLPSRTFFDRHVTPTTPKARQETAWICCTRTWGTVCSGLRPLSLLRFWTTNWNTWWFWKMIPGLRNRQLS